MVQFRNGSLTQLPFFFFSFFFGGGGYIDPTDFETCPTTNEELGTDVRGAVVDQYAVELLRSGHG